jgi:hypothetical protein
MQYSTAMGERGLKVWAKGILDSSLVTHYQCEFNQSNEKTRMYSVEVDSIIHVIVAYEAIQCHREHSHDHSTKKRMGKSLCCMDKITKRVTQNDDREEQELVRVEEQYIVVMTI